MKNSVVKIISMVLVAVICLFSLPVSVYAEDDGFQIVLNSGRETAYIQKYTGTAENVVIPSHTKSGVPITSIEMDAFLGNKYIKSVTVPETVKVIEQNAFYGCTNLFNISLPDSLERIEWNVFKNTAFYNNTNVWFDYTLYVDGYLIENRHNEIGPVNISHGTKGIAEGAFASSQATSVHIPKTVRFIGESAFNDIFFLEEFTVDPENPYFKSIDGVLFTADNVIFRYPYSKENSSYTIPKGTKGIANHCFDDLRNLVELHLSATVSYVDRFAFLNNSGTLESVTVDSNSKHFKSIDGVLYTADGKTLVYYPQGKTDKKLVVPDGVSEVAHLALRYNDNIEEIVFGEGLTRVNEFSYLENLKVITFPETVEYFDRFCFNGCYNLEVINFGGTEQQWKAACGRSTFGEDATINFLYDGSVTFTTEPEVTSSVVTTVATDSVENTSSVVTTVATDPAESTSADVTATVIATEAVTDPEESSTAIVTTVSTDPAESTTAETEPATTAVAENTIATTNTVTNATTDASISTEATEVTTTLAVSDATETATAPVTSAPADNTKPTEAPDKTHPIGDVNLDGKLNIRDATLIQKYLAKMVEFNETVLNLADIDLNGKVNIKDATYIQKKIANII